MHSDDALAIVEDWPHRTTSPRLAASMWKKIRAAARMLHLRQKGQFRITELAEQC